MFISLTLLPLRTLRLKNVSFETASSYKQELQKRYGKQANYMLDPVINQADK
jgi:hypothetical protein